jgi:site-specific DNA recombinase
MDSPGIRSARYARISLDKAGDEHGVANQLADQQRVADARGFVIVRTECDNDISALNGKHRPGYEAVMAAAARGEIDVILVFQTSRFWRNRRERAEGIEILRKAGVSLIATKGPSLDMSTAYGRGMAGLLGEFDTMESEVKAERQQLAAFHRAENGQPPAGVRLTGYTPKGEVVEDEARTVQQMFNRFYQGDSLRGLVAWLGEQGVPTRSEIRARAALDKAEAVLAEKGEDEALRAMVGKLRAQLNRMEQKRLAGTAWNPSSVRTILTNPRYAGRAVYQGQVNGQAGVWPPLVEEWLFDTVQARLSDPRRRKQVGTDRKHLGSGLYLCGVCGLPVRSHGRASRGKPRVTSYRCPAGGHVTRNAEPVDSFVLRVVRTRLARPDLAQILAKPSSPETGKAAAQITQLRARLNKTKQDYDDDLIDGARYKVKTAKLAAELDMAEAAQARLTAGSEVAGTLAAPDPVAAFDAAPLGVQRAVISFMMAVRLDLAPRGRHFDSATVDIQWKQRLDDEA